MREGRLLEIIGYDTREIIGNGNEEEETYLFIVFNASYEGIAASRLYCPLSVRE